MNMPQKGAAANHRDIWVFIEQADGEPLPVALELLSKGRDLAKNSNAELCAVIFGGSDETLGTLADFGAGIIYRCGGAAPSAYDEEIQTQRLANLVREYSPDVFLFGATGFGRSLAPRLAARLGTGLTADCIMLDIDSESGFLLQTRPAFGGSLMAVITCPDKRPQMATVRPGVFCAVPIPRNHEPNVINVETPAEEITHVRLISESCEAPDPGISGADIIVSAGLGIGHVKNLALVERLASLLGAQVGASRPLIESGWLPYRHQIGQTGCSVAPKLLLAFGISGAVQHLAGISGAERIIAVNNDPDAPIFSVAHYAIVGDCREILCNMISILE